MKLWSVHLVFGALLVGSLSAQQRGADNLSEIPLAEFAPAVTRIAEAQGLRLRGHMTAFGNVPSLSFDMHGCPRPVTVVLGVNFDIAPFVQATARETGDMARYVYIGRSWGKPQRLAFFAYRMQYAVLATFGLSRYVPGGHLLLIEAPLDCRSIETLDWRNAWNRAYVKALQHEVGAAG